MNELKETLMQKRNKYRDLQDCWETIYQQDKGELYNKTRDKAFALANYYEGRADAYDHALTLI